MQSVSAQPESDSVDLSRMVSVLPERRVSPSLYKHSDVPSVDRLDLLGPQMDTSSLEKGVLQSR